MLSSVVSSAVQYFSTLSHYRRDFRKRKYNEYGLWDLIFYTVLCETLLIVRTIRPNTHKHTPVCMLFLSGFNETWILSTDFRKIFIIKFHEILSKWRWVFPQGQTVRRTEGQTNGQTDMTKVDESKNIITKNYYHELITYRRQISVDCKFLKHLFSD